MAGIYTKAQAKASKRYDSKFEKIVVRVPEGQREKYKKIAEDKGLSLNQYIIKLLEKGV